MIHPEIAQIRQRTIERIAEFEGVTFTSVIREKYLGITATVICRCGKVTDFDARDFVRERRKTPYCHACATGSAQRADPNSINGKARAIGIKPGAFRQRIKKHGLEQAIAMGSGDARRRERQGGLA